MDSGGSTALHYACAGGHLDVVDVLIENKANHHLQDHSHLIARRVAILNGHRDVAERLPDGDSDGMATHNVSGYCSVYTPNM